MTQRIGLIGLGIMGAPMARNLLKAGVPTTVHSRTASKVAALVAAGAAAASSAREVAERTDVVITMLPDTPDVRQVVLGPDGVVAGGRPGLILIDMSTIAPAATRALAESLAAHGMHMLDAPVSGGESGAIAGTLSIMVGGDAAILERCRPILAALGTRITHMGPSGCGQMTKLCNQVVGALTLHAVVEGLVLARQAGMDMAGVIEALSGGAADSWMLRNLGPRMAAGDFAPGFFVRLQQKDLRLVAEWAATVHANLPGTVVTSQLLGVVEAMGGGELGTQALFLALERLSGIGAAQRGPGSAGS